MGRTSANSLSPGFRFHPTDEELVRYYLRRKISAKPFRFDPISVVDIYKSEPWDLPDKSKLKSRDLEWYFFSALDKKYGNGSKTNRATEKGYWKTTGKDRPVQHKSRVVGMKKTLVYHLGRAPRGERTNWVMHEYRMIDEELRKDGVMQDAFVLCRIFQKSGSGPKNGEQYGAPFVEEEWEDEVVVGDDDYVELNDIDEKLGIKMPKGDASVPLNFCYGDTNNYAEHSVDYVENDPNPISGMDDNQCASVLHGDQKLVDVPEQDKPDVKSVKDEFVGESSNNDDSLDLDFLLDDSLFDATDNPLLDDGLFLETNDLLNPVPADPTGIDMLEEYLTYFDANDDNSDYLVFDPSHVTGTENSSSYEAPLAVKNMNESMGQMSTVGQQLFEVEGNNGASSSKKNPEDAKFESGFSYPFVKHAYQMLGNIPAPPAFASEFPAKDLALRLKQVAQSSNPTNATTGMIRFSNMTLSGHGLDLSFGKNGNVNIILSFGLSQGDVDSTNLVPTDSSKPGPAIPRGWFYLMFIWGLIIVSASFKIGSCICSK